MSLDLEPTVAATLFEHSLSIVREKAAKRRLHLGLDVPPELGTLLIDPRKTKQIIYNLLSNAVKFSPEGGRVTLGCPPRRAGRRRGLERRCRDRGVAGPAPCRTTATICRSWSRTPASGSRPRMRRGCSGCFPSWTRPWPRRPRAPAWAWRWSNGWRSCMAAAWPWPARRGKAAASSCGCHGAKRARPPGRCRRYSTSDAASAGRPLALVIEDNDHAAELIRLQLESEGFEIIRAATARQALDALAGPAADGHHPGSAAARHGRLGPAGAAQAAGFRVGAHPGGHRLDRGRRAQGLLPGRQRRPAKTRQPRRTARRAR